MRKNKAEYGAKGCIELGAVVALLSLQLGQAYRFREIQGSLKSCLDSSAAIPSSNRFASALLV